MPELGQIVGGKYRLERLLGEGGMGSVYEAVHVRIGGRVAVKFLAPELSNKDAAIERFELEAKAAGAIGHDGIVGIHDIGTDDDGAHYLVMELLRGETLRQRIARTPRLTAPFATYLACEALSALQAAHDAGIVHRDLKPENVFLVDTGAALPRVKLVDFGISRVSGAAGLREDGERLTVDGSVMGTPEYMSPEQARGRADVDHRADLFAVGVILYECLLGRTPFDDANYNAILSRILTEEAPPLRLGRPDLPDGLDVAILRALVKDREGRFQSASELFDAIVPYAQADGLSRLSMPSGRYRARSGASGSGEVSAVLSPPLGSASGERTLMTWESPRPSPSVPMAGARRRVAVAAFVAAAVVAGGVTIAVAFATTRGHGDGVPLVAAAGQVVASKPGPSSAQASADRGAVAQPASPLAVIDVLGIPEGATAFLDDAEVADLPLRLALGGQSRQLRVEAQGFETYRRMVTPTADQVIRVELEPSAAGTEGAATGEERPAASSDGSRRSRSRASSRRRSRPRARQDLSDYRPTEW